jgi:predicted nucleic acid-binding protein
VAYLLDSNVLIRLFVPSDPDHAPIRRALREMRIRGEARCYVSQCLAEFWNVCTRPASARGGYGLSVAQADRRARVVERVFTFLPDSAAMHHEWRRLIVSHGVSGVQVYDARLVASMSVHGATHLLTLNPGDFSRYSGITTVHPRNN